MSIAGGPAQALLRGRLAGCDTIQMFTRPANRWTARDLTDAELEDFFQARQETGIAPVVAHSSYLVNLASPDDELWQRSIAAVVNELQRCRQLGINHYVLHPGAHMGSGEEAGLRRIAAGLDSVYTTLGETNTLTLLETTAGQGSLLGCRFEQLGWLLAHSQASEHLGVCFDTAHVLAAGYEFRDADSYAALWQTFDELVGLDRLRALHLNDSKRERGSHVDRHEQIGRGYVTLEAFRLIVNDPRLRRVPMFLETPKGPDLREDIENLALLRNLIVR